MRDLIGQTLGHYRIVEKIGEGGMGEVYRAHDERLDRDVAIKVLHESVAQDADRLARFEREAKAVAKLDHPNILSIHDFGTEGGVAYAVMELLEGEALRELISKDSITTGKAVEYARSIADGLAAAHGKGIIHRDLKPENVFLTTDGRIKILDFGLAKLKLPEADLTTETPTATLDTAAGSLIGTVPYMAPEQVQGQPADHRSDIFALGVVLYEMLTGQRPFGGSTTVETAAAILKEDPEPISVASGVPPTLAGVVSKCLEKRPDDRFNSAHDLALTLGAIDTAAPAPPVEDRSLITRRWPHILAIVIAAIIALLVILPPEALFERGGEEPADVPLPRIVVLPFENLGPPEDEYFADGLTSEIINRLAVVSGLEVISRTGAMRYKNTDSTIPQIGEELAVDYALEGEVRWERESEGHGRVRITPQLILVATDSQVWSERYDRVLEDIFSVQSDIAEQVIAELQATLEPERRAIETRPTDNMEAYQAYLLGVQYWWTRRDERHQRLTVEMLERAVRLDPEFAVAHAMLSQAHSRMYHYRYDFTPKRLEIARASAGRAMELQPGIPEGHRALGYYYDYGFRDYDRALEQFAIAAETLTNDTDLAMAIFAVYRRQGRWDEALQAHEKWRRIDPQGYSVAVEAALTYQFLREFESSEQATRRAISIAPDRAEAYWEAGALNYLAWDGSTERARSLLASAPSLDSPEIEYTSLLIDLFDRKPEVVLARLEDLSVDVFDFQFWYSPRELLECMCLTEMGELKRARRACSSAIGFMEGQIQSRPHDYRVYGALGRAFALLGQSEEAVRAGQRAVELMPISKYPIAGSDQLIKLAKIYSRVGEADKALDLIEELLSIPCFLSVGLLRLDPVWDPLRGHPRFQELLEKYDTD